MEQDYFKDILFDRINEWDQDILEVRVNDRENMIWVELGDGSVFRIHCEKENFHSIQLQQDGK